MIPVLRELCGVALAATMSRMIRSPVRPVMSLTTNGNWRFIWTNAFCMLECDRCGLHERLSMPDIGAQRDDRINRTKAPRRV